MFPPVDPTRRRFLAVAAVASAVSAGTLAAATQAANVPQAVTVPQGADPIYAAIEVHREAYVTMQAVFAEHRQAHDLADVKVGPAYLDIPSMVDPGETVEASCWWDVERAIPRKQYPDQFLHYKKLVDERKAAHAAIVESLIGDEDEATDVLAHAELDARDAFSETVPTTVSGLLAMIVYAGEISENDPEAFADRDCSLIENLAIAAKALMKGGSTNA